MQEVLPKYSFNCRNKFVLESKFKISNIINLFFKIKIFKKTFKTNTTNYQSVTLFNFIEI